MKSEQDTAPKPWAILGKVGTAIGIIWVIVQLIRALFPGNEYRVTAHGAYSCIELPEPCLEEIQKLHNPHVALSNLKRIHSIWWFSIKNTGEKEVRDLNLEVPFDGMYTIQRSGEEPEFSDFIRSVEIGALRPSQEIEVTVWADEGGWRSALDPTCLRSESKETRLTHPNGVIPVVYPEKVTGALAWYAGKDYDSWGSFSRVVITLISLAVIGLVFFLLWSLFGADK